MSGVRGPGPRPPRARSPPRTGPRWDSARACGRFYLMGPRPARPRRIAARHASDRVAGPPAAGVDPTEHAADPAHDERRVGPVRPELAGEPAELVLGTGTARLSRAVGLQVGLQLRVTADHRRPQRLVARLIERVRDLV